MSQENIVETKRLPKDGRSAPALAWMKKEAVISVDDNETYPIDSSIGGMNDLMKGYLHSIGMDALFSIQKAVWEMTCGGTSNLHDLCFSAPTGSGKTLAYALPVVNALYRRQEKGCLRCVIVLPTRGLALQVHAVVQPLGKALGLESIAVCGTSSVLEEAEILMKENGIGCDIAIFTPGRLVSHIESTYGFDQKLENISFLVIDEADRLLRQRYNDWLPKILNRRAQTLQRIVKVVVSATLTRDPSKLEILRLHAPRLVTFVQEEHKYKLPSTLEESKIIIADKDKPAALCTLLNKQLGGCIVFVSSVEAAATLVRLLNIIMEDFPIHFCKTSSSTVEKGVDDASHTAIIEYSAAMTPKEREEALTAFKMGRCRILVCSDAITRGIDIQGVNTVINYDAPVYAKTYVHRAGRTARAGNMGKVITLLRKEDVRHFKNMLRKADNNYVTDEVLDSEVFKASRTWVTEAIKKMMNSTSKRSVSGTDGDEASRKKKPKKKKRTVYPSFMPEVPAIHTLT